MNRNKPETFEDRKARCAAEVAILNAVRRALAKCAHHEAFTRRIKPVIEKELGDSCYVTVTPKDGTFSDHKIHVSTRGPDSFSVDLSAYTNTRDYPNDTWQAAFERAIVRNDCTDYIEREESEQAIHGKLAKLEAQIEKARADAAALVAALPLPPSATIRQAWGPSAALSAKFPLLFKS
jgi:hypothetical protein